MASLSLAQGNLVPNPSFEDTIKCVTGNSQFYECVQSWSAYGCDYFNSDCQGFQVGVPDNFAGYQFPRTGKAYAGLIMRFHDNIPLHKNVRDYIETRLAQPLTANKTYCVSFFVSLGNHSWYSCTDIGAYFSQDTVTFTNNYVINVNPQVVSNVGLYQLSDTLNWIEIRGYYTAVGSEQYLTIGNFKPDSLSTDSLAYSAETYACAYYYIDDVSVTEYAEAQSGPNITICAQDSVQLGATPQNGIVYDWSPATGLSDTLTAQPWATPQHTTTYYLSIIDTTGNYCVGNVVDSVTVTVNDCSTQEFFIPMLLTAGQQFMLPGIPDGSTLELFNSLGQVVFRRENYHSELNASSFSAGIYYCRILFPDKTVRREKICILH